MTNPQRPACLSQPHQEELANGLLRVSCRYQPERLLDDSFLLAGIPLPVTLRTAVAKRKAEYLTMGDAADPALGPAGRAVFIDAGDSGGAQAL